MRYILPYLQILISLYVYNNILTYFAQISDFKVEFYSDQFYIISSTRRLVLKPENKGKVLKFKKLCKSLKI